MKYRHEIKYMISKNTGEILKQKLKTIKIHIMKIIPIKLDRSTLTIHKIPLITKNQMEQNIEKNIELESIIKMTISSDQNANTNIIT